VSGPTETPTDAAGQDPFPPTDLPGPVPVTWTRLHPLSPVITFGRTVSLVLVIIVPRLATSNGDVVGLGVEAGILLLGVVAGIVSWLVTRWRVAGSELQIETGLLRRQSIRLPLARVQAIDVDRPLLARLFGLAELRVQVAGSGSGRGRLAYLPEEEAVRVRARLLALANGLHADTPAPPGRVLFRVDNVRLVLSTLLGTPMVVLAGLLIAAVVLGILTDSAAAAIGMLPAIVAVGAILWRRLNAEFTLTVAEAPDGLRVDGGLLGTRHETVPLPRVQAVRWVEPLFWRPFGWCRLEIDVAQQRTARSGEDASAFPNRALLPVGTAAEARTLLGRVLPQVDPHRALRSRPPRRARLKAPFAYPNLGIWSDDRYVVCASGRLRRTFVLVPLAKVQSLRVVQGPYARFLRLATVHVDVVGRQWVASAHARDADEAEQLWPALAERARRARRARGA
jgi:putative membrane protein